MELVGRVLWYEPKKGYGFIEAKDGSGDYFVHFGDIAPEERVVLNPGDIVKFTAGETPYGPRALRVRKQGSESAFPTVRKTHGTMGKSTS